MREKVVSAFKNKFSAEPRLYRSPGRINIIGEHIDYNNGFVFPAATDKEMIVAIKANSNTINRIYSIDFDEMLESDSSEINEGHWSGYILGCIELLKSRGFDLPNIDCAFGGNVPIGSGMSSSAALECAVLFSLNDYFELGIEKKQLALFAQEVEHKYVGVQCGIMDQFASVFGEKNQAIKLDCDSLDYELVPLQLEGFEFILVNSMVKHSLAGSEYNTRREECAEGLKLAKERFEEIKSFRDLDLEILESLKPGIRAEVYNRCKFVIEEIERVDKASLAMKNGDFKALGELLYACHDGLSHLYEVSCEELDYLVQFTRDMEMVLGSRMMGGGFGGCTLNLVNTDESQEFIDTIKTKYKEKFNIDPEIYKVKTADGSSRI